MIETRNPRIGSSLDGFLKAEGIHEELQVQALKEVVAWQLEDGDEEKPPIEGQPCDAASGTLLHHRELPRDTIAGICVKNLVLGKASEAPTQHEAQQLATFNSFRRTVRGTRTLGAKVDDLFDLRKKE